jgi:hypothetical protein
LAMAHKRSPRERQMMNRERENTNWFTLITCLIAALISVISVSRELKHYVNLLQLCTVGIAPCMDSHN